MSSLGCWLGVSGAWDRCLASLCPPPELGQLPAPPCPPPPSPPAPTSVRFQAVPWRNFDLERMSDRSGCFPGPSHATEPWPELPCHLLTHWDTGQLFWGSGDTEGVFSAFLPCVVLSTSIHRSVISSCTHSFSTLPLSTRLSFTHSTSFG